MNFLNGIYKFFLLSLITLVLVTCNQDSKISYVLFSGKIDNPYSSFIRIDGRNNFKQKIKINTDGTFTDTLYVNEGYYFFHDGREGSHIFLSSGDDLFLTFDGSLFFETINYEGNKGAGNNNYLITKSKQKEKLTSLNSEELYSLDEESFLREVNSMRKLQYALLQNATSIDTHFKNIESKNIEFTYLNYLQTYPSMHQYYTNNNIPMPETFSSLLQDFLLNNGYYYEMLESYEILLKHHYYEEYKNSKNLTLFFDKLKKIESSEIKNGLANTFINDIKLSNKNLKILFKGLKDLSNNNEFETLLNKKYNSLKKLNRGQPSPIFSDYKNYNGELVSLADLKGKYVYIDVWVTWCKPCIKELPYLKQVKKDYVNKNIVFVGISVDLLPMHTNWVNMIEEKKLGGLQLLADNSFDSKFIGDYAINDIPHYIFIDPDGNIISADAPRPSDPELRELLEDIFTFNNL